MEPKDQFENDRILFWWKKPPGSARNHSCLRPYAKLAISNEAITKTKTKNLNFGDKKAIILETWLEVLELLSQTNRPTDRQRPTELVLQGD